MGTAMKAYEGTFIVGFRPKYAPDPSCCSEPDVLCRKCAEKALATNAGNRSIDRDDYLPLPTMDFGSEPPDNVACENSEDDLLIPPVINWADEVAHRQTRRVNASPSSRPTDDTDSDYLPLPRMF